jgi:ABC-type Zn uptake system ZnuABC Zn-binding protein ZnuA
MTAEALVRSAMLAPIALLVLLAAACTDDGGGGDGAQLTVVTTLPVFQDFVREIGGDRVEVLSLLPPGSDPHTYEPTPREVAKLSGADLAFSNGLQLEGGSTGEIIDTNLGGGALHVRLAEEAEEAGALVREFEEGEGHADEEEHEGEEEHEEEEHEGEEEEGHAHGSEDPHLWLSVDNAREYARIILEALTDTDPEGAAEYQANYQDYLSRLDDLDEYIADNLSALPEENGKLITTHDAFGYMADYLGLEVLAFVVESPGQEPSAQDVGNLVEAIEDSGVPAVFEEPQLGGSGTVLERAAEDAGVEVCTLYSDALDNKVPTYIDLIRFNVDELARCLG